MRARILKIPFKVKYEIHDRKKFQSEGHFVPALREEDAEGNPTRKPREWSGNEVHCLTLVNADGEPAKFEGQSVCRVLSDSLADAERLFRRTFEETFWSNLKALENISFQGQQLVKSCKERTDLMNWMLSNGHRKEAEEILAQSYRVTTESGTRIVSSDEALRIATSGVPADIQHIGDAL